jgi:hypothetical protein
MLLLRLSYHKRALNALGERVLQDRIVLISCVHLIASVRPSYVFRLRDREGDAFQTHVVPLDAELGAMTDNRGGPFEIDGRLGADLRIPEDARFAVITAGGLAVHVESQVHCCANNLQRRRRTATISRECDGWKNWTVNSDALYACNYPSPLIAVQARECTEKCTARGSLKQIRNYLTGTSFVLLESVENCSVIVYASIYPNNY